VPDGGLAISYMVAKGMRKSRKGDLEAAHQRIAQLEEANAKLVDMCSRLVWHEKLLRSELILAEEGSMTTPVITRRATRRRKHNSSAQVVTPIVTGACDPMLRVDLGEGTLGESTGLRRHGDALLSPGSLSRVAIEELLKLPPTATATEIDAAFARASQASHAWSPCPGHSFSLRDGPDYRKTGLKRPSGPALYDVVAVDVFSCPEQKANNVGRVFDLPRDEFYERYGVPLTLIVSYLIPDYAQSVFERREDGPGWAVVMTCRLSAEARQIVSHGSRYPPALALWHQFVHADPASPLRRRLKSICGLANLHGLAIDKVSMGIIAKYNFKPVLCRTTGCYYANESYFAIEVDVHRWGRLALNGFNALKSQVGKMLIRLGVVIESVEDDEMPEQLLAGSYLSRLNAADCPTLPALPRQLQPVVAQTPQPGGSEPPLAAVDSSDLGNEPLRGGRHTRQPPPAALEA